VVANGDELALEVTGFGELWFTGSLNSKRELRMFS
jgi:hypothetical protein